MIPLVDSLLMIRKSTYTLYKKNLSPDVPFKIEIRAQDFSDEDYASLKIIDGDDSDFT